MDPLSVTASVTGILAVTAKISVTLFNLTSRAKHAPQGIRDLKIEVDSFRAILEQVQELVIVKQTSNSSRASWILVNQVVVIMSSCVIGFSEVELFVNSLKGDIGFRERLKWAQKASTAAELLVKIQIYKLSLNTMLTILESQAMTEAAEASSKLNSLVEQVLNSNRMIEERLRSIETGVMASAGVSPVFPNLMSGGLSLASGRRAGEASIDSRLITQQGVQRPFVPSAQASSGPGFEDVLYTTWVYKRVRYDDQAFSLASTGTNKTASWSMLSGLSMSDVSNISVVALPIFAADITNGYHYKFGDLEATTLSSAPAPAMPTPTIKVETLSLKEQPVQSSQETRTTETLRNDNLHVGEELNSSGDNKLGVPNVLQGVFSRNGSLKSLIRRSSKKLLTRSLSDGSPQARRGPTPTNSDPSSLGALVVPAGASGSEAPDLTSKPPGSSTKLQSWPVDPRRSVFGVDIRSSITYAYITINMQTSDRENGTAGKVPIVLYRCGSFIKDHGMSIPDLFSRADYSLQCQALVNKFEDDMDFGRKLDPNLTDAKAYASVLLHYLTALPEPLIPLGRYQSFKQLFLFTVTPDSTMAEGFALDLSQWWNRKLCAISIRKRMQQLHPVCHVSTIFFLRLLLKVAANSSVTGMDLDYLVDIFQPVILRPPPYRESSGEVRFAKKMCKFMIESADDLPPKLSASSQDVSGRSNAMDESEYHESHGDTGQSTESSIGSNQGH